MLRRRHSPETGYSVLPTKTLTFQEQAFLGHLNTVDTEHSKAGNFNVHQEGRRKENNAVCLFSSLFVTVYNTKASVSPAWPSTCLK